MSEPAETWHCILTGGQIIAVSRETRREVERWLAGLEYPRDYFAQHTIDDIDGAEVTLFADAIAAIYETTAETRQVERARRKLMEDENMAQGFHNED